MQASIVRIGRVRSGRNEGLSESQAEGSRDMELQSCNVERRSDGAVLVRVHSSRKDGQRLPDAVFTFREGDPQYEYWDQISQQPPFSAGGPAG